MAIAFAELKASLDELWTVTAAPRKGWWQLVRARLLSFGLLLTIGFLLLVSLLVSTLLATVGARLGGAFASLAWLAELLNVTATLGAGTLLFAAIFKLLPDARIAWRDVWIGAVITAMLFVYRQDADRPLPRRHGLRERLRGRGLAGRRRRMGLLLFADPVPRCRVHARVRGGARNAENAAGAPGTGQSTCC